MILQTKTKPARDSRISVASSKQGVKMDPAEKLRFQPLSTQNRADISEWLSCYLQNQNGPECAYATHPALTTRMEVRHG